MRRSRSGSLRVVSGVALAIALGAVPLAGQEIKVGGQVSFGDDADFGLGPRAQADVPWVAPGVWVAASFDYFFPDSGLGDPGGDYDYRELNVNVLGDLSIARATNLVPYIGGGANFAWQEVPSGSDEGSDDGSDEGEGSSESLFGLNLVAGFRFPLVGFTPFVELRYELQGGEQLLIAGGVLLP
ncbi:hypothetical protein [Candidatus Palauibacter sp.]|uniref:hypothetical protein n=1 Tax=Candidatus Palauibacter sp. TaxID=3101350 RepID=UPI003CC626DC